MLSQFNKNFGISSTLEEEKTAFINRSNTFFRFLRRSLDETDGYFPLFKFVCFELGRDPYEVIRENTSLVKRGTPDLVDIFYVYEQNLLNVLKIWVIIRDYLSNDWVKEIDKHIISCLEKANVDLQISYNSGMFYPKGEEQLDKDLIDHSLTVLRNHPAEDQDLRLALNNYRQGNTSGVIDKCYTCIEGLTRATLNNGKTLINNKIDLLRHLKLSDNWKGILNLYIEFGNEYARHASPNRHSITDEEVEAFLYTTCLLVRLTLRANP